MKRDRILARMVAAMGELNLKVFRAWKGVLEAKRLEADREQIKLRRFAAKLFNARQQKIWSRWYMFVETTKQEKFW